MKRLFVLMIMFSTVHAFGQVPANNVTGNIPVPRELELGNNIHICSGTSNSIKDIAFFIDGKFASLSMLKTLSPDCIDDIKVVKKTIVIDNIKYTGQIHMKTNSSYVPKRISQTVSKEKYPSFKQSK